jgi:low temperature requirement protein LtrA
MDEKITTGVTREFIEQRTSWLELFYDLAYVAAIAQLTYLLVSNTGALEEHAQFVFLFAAVFMSWFGNVVYRNIKGEEDDNFDRVVTIISMFFALMMSVSLHDAFGAGALGFIIGYVGTRIAFLALIRHAYQLEGSAAPRTLHVLWGYRIAVLVWIASLFIPEPFRYAVWVAALSLEMLAPFTKSFMSRSAPNNPRILNKHHLPERLGLFTILVMGESFIVVAVVNNIADGLITPQNGIVASAAFLIMVGIWWLYFNDVERYARGKSFHLFRYIYAHMPILIGVMYLAAGTKIGMVDPLGGADPFSIVAIGIGVSMVGLNLIKLATGQRTLRLFWPTVLLLTLLVLYAPINQLTFPLAIMLLTAIFAGYVYVENRECRIAVR